MKYSIFNKKNIEAVITFLLGGTLVVFPTMLITVTAEKGFPEGLKYAFLYTGIIIGLFASFILGLAFIAWIVNLCAHTTVRAQKMEKIDFLGSKDLYRDILEKYSPVTLSYIDQMDYNPVVAVVAGLLGLENKKYIKLNDGTIEFLKEEDENMSMSEKYIYRRMKAGEKTIEAETLWNDIIYDGCESGLLEEHNSEMSLKTWGWSLILLFGLSIFADIIKAIMGEAGEGVGAFMVFAIWLFFCLYITYKYGKSGHRTKEAIEINTKLEGLKVFLREYSTLKDRESDEIALWEDYLIYSVIFKQNKKIISEYKKYFEII